MYVVTGVTGHTGSVVAQALLDREQSVKVIVRTAKQGESWKQKGAEVAVCSLEDARSFAKALEGATGAYLLVPPNYQTAHHVEDRRNLIDAVAVAVAQSRLPHVVFLSSIGAQLSDATGPIRVLHYGERRLAEVVRNLTIVRAPYFMENWMATLGEVRAQGVLPSFLTPERKIPMVATRDIGLVAAECLLDQPKGRRVLELSGPQDYSPNDVAVALSQRLERRVQVQQLPLDAVVRSRRARVASRSPRHQKTVFDRPTALAFGPPRGDTPRERAQWSRVYGRRPRDPVAGGRYEPIRRRRVGPSGPWRPGLLPSARSEHR